MRICILGWYGTETLGDRAILDGIIKIFRKQYADVRFAIGAIYTFYTERTVYEDSNLFGSDIEIFNEKSLHEMKKIIKNSDMVLMGGGPLMDLLEMYLIHKGFCYAKRYHKPTVLCGCGLGPIYKEEYLNITKRILDITDLAIFRDENSEKKAKEMCKKLNCCYLPDPAIVSIIEYKKTVVPQKNNSVAVNFRMFPKGFYGESEFGVTDAVKIVECLSDKYDEVKLVPMHTFFAGGDDRIFLNDIKKQVQKGNVTLVNVPQGLYDTYRMFAEAQACVGMRYHSVVMQTILNGNNFIIDYTVNQKGGKIESFISETDEKGFYNKRKISINDISNAASMLEVLDDNVAFEYVERCDIIDEYIKQLSTLI